jgi:hypothetical protein
MSEYIYNLEFDTNYKVEEPIYKIVHQIVCYIKNERNFEKAFETIKNNNLSFQDVVNRTGRLDTQDVTTLADLLISRL